MKKMFFGVFLVALAAGVYGQQRITVMVPPFNLVEGVSQTERDTITRLFLGRLSATGVVTVVNTANLQQRMDYLTWELSDWSNNEKKGQLNAGFNADYLIIGNISRLFGELWIDITAEDLNTFAVAGNADVALQSGRSPDAKINELVTGIVRTMAGGRGGGTAVRPGNVPDNFVRVEGGTFRMGSASGGDSDERPVHSVTVKSFYMGKYEVTQKEWAEIMGSNPSNFKGDNLPVEMVSWHDAIEYCNKRSLREGLTPAYRGSGDSVTCDLSASGYRLPTEAEWEYAAKGGNKDPMTYEYSGGNSAGSVGWYTDNSGNRTHPAGQKQPNSLGLYDMSGNVWEWCWDWYGNYPSGSQTDPLGPASGSRRVLRGGSWGYSAPDLRSAYRGYNSPTLRYSSLGFRLVRP
jgi:formylglycine-generating enzyme required for sulfatase activity